MVVPVGGVTTGRSLVGGALGVVVVDASGGSDVVSSVVTGALVVSTIVELVVVGSVNVVVGCHVVVVSAIVEVVLEVLVVGVCWPTNQFAGIGANSPISVTYPIRAQAPPPFS